MYSEKKTLTINVKDLFSIRLFISFMSNIFLFFTIKLYKDKNIIIFIKMDKYLWGGILTAGGAAAGSLLYIAISDLYKIKITKSQDTTTEIKSYRPFLNPGMVIGLSLGASRAYLGYPVLDYFSKSSNTKLLKNE